MRCSVHEPYQYFDLNSSSHAAVPVVLGRQWYLLKTIAFGWQFGIQEPLAKGEVEPWHGRSSMQPNVEVASTHIETAGFGK